MDLDNEELEATRKLHGLDKKSNIEEDIKTLEVENYYLEELGYLRENNHFIKFNQALKNLIKAYKELEEENKELISDNLDYQRTLDIFDKRTYRKKYLEERRKEEPNLLYPDADEIYKRYYKLREENKELKKDNKRYEKELHDVIELSIPVSLVEEKIEELNKLLEEDLQDEIKVNSNRFIIIWQCKKCLQELLEKRK